jgi:hypothetical protein
VKTHRRAIALAGLLAACGSFRDPGDLRYARVLAVRADPPRVSPGQRARIELLVTGNDGVPVVRGPDLIVPAPPQPGQPAAPAEAAQLITQESGAWYVAAPSDTVLAQLRQAFGLPPGSDAPIPFPLSVSATVEGQARVAEKTVWLGGTAVNPTVSAVTVDGRPLEGSLSIAAAGIHPLAGTAAGAGTLSYAWYSGIGTLKKYREPTATLEDLTVGQEGALVLVVRDDKGGVTWKLGDLRAE